MSNKTEVHINLIFIIYLSLQYNLFEKVHGYVQLILCKAISPKYIIEYFFFFKLTCIPFNSTIICCLYVFNGLFPYGLSSLFLKLARKEQCTFKGARWNKAIILQTFCEHLEWCWYYINLISRTWDNKPFIISLK